MELFVVWGLIIIFFLFLKKSTNILTGSYEHQGRKDKRTRHGRVDHGCMT